MAEGRALLVVTPEFLVELLKAGGLPSRVDVVAHPLPDDTRFVGVRWDEDRCSLLLVLASQAFPPPDADGAIQPLPSPHVRLVDSDRQIVHDACRLRAALITELKTWTGDLPSHLVELLATTTRYRRLEIGVPKGAGHA